MTIQTAPNILTTIEVPFTGYNVQRERWEITYSISQTNLIEGKTSVIVANRTISILDTDLTDFAASWSTVEELTEASFAKVIEREQIEEWDGTVIDDIENDPEAETIQPWVANELVAPPNRRSYNGKVYAVVQAHTTLANWTPDIVPALFTYLFDEDSGGDEYQAWVAPTGSHDAYEVGAIVHFPTLDDPLYINTSPANAYAPDVFGCDLYTP